VNGYRIELGEIEKIVQSDPAVVSAVCCVKDKILAMYVKLLPLGKSSVSAAAGDDNISELAYGGDISAIASRLRRICLDELPSYMIPQAFVHLDEIPLSSNGKVDRKRLRPPTAEERMLASSSNKGAIGEGKRSEGPEMSFVAPSNRIEKQVAELYASVLNLDPASISMTHNFFDLGGDSLAALRLLALVQGEFRISLGVPTLFEAPTVAQFTQEILERRAEMETEGIGVATSGVDGHESNRDQRRQQLELVRLQTGSSGRTPLLLVHAAGSSVMHYRELVSHFDPSQPVLAVEDRSLQSDSAFPFSFESIHDVADSILELILSGDISRLRGASAFNSRGEATTEPTMFVGGWSYGGVVALEVASRLEASGISVPSVFLLDAPVRTNQTILREVQRGKSETKHSHLGEEGMGAVDSAGAIHFDNCTRLLQQHVCANQMVRSDVVTVRAEMSDYGIGIEDVAECTVGGVSEYLLQEATHWNTCTGVNSEIVGDIVSHKMEQHRLALNFVRASVPVFEPRVEQELSSIFG
jgi:thioesterase domain-containing protein/acyl carrier protein